MRADDPAYVREQYATEEGLAARTSIYGGANDARDVVLDLLQEAGPTRVLEVGCGWGELAVRMRDTLGCEVVAIDQSERMIELARERGVDARVGDVQHLAFGAEEFDAVVAAWMLYHVPDLPHALRECARVLRRGGMLVAVTNAASDFEELWTLVGRDVSERLGTLRSENGEETLREHFQDVDRHDVESDVTFADAEAIRRYVGSSSLGHTFAANVPKLDEPLVSRKRVTVFVATKAA